MENKTLNTFLKTQIDKIWNYWEQRHFDSYDCIDINNKVGQFADWFDGADDDDLLNITNTTDDFLPQIKRAVNKAINNYFN